MLERKTAPNGAVYYSSTLLADRRVPHAFSTRLGGVSRAPFDSLNLGNPNGCDVQDVSPNIAENYRKLQAAVDCSHRQHCYVHQVHGALVANVKRGRHFNCSTQADALVSDDPARMLSVRIADCVPILLASDDGRLVAAVHAGWRGVVAGVVGAAIAELRRQSSAPLVAAIGPCIGLDCFEVGSDVLDSFVTAFGKSAPIRREANGKGRVDLRRAVSRQLEEVGLKPEQIDSADLCTYRDSDEFFSHRRNNGVTGRMAAIIAPRQ